MEKDLTGTGMDFSALKQGYDDCQLALPVVKSVAGRDKNRLLVVVDATQERVLVIDGKERSVERPKRKNPKHIIHTGYSLPEEVTRFNNPLRKALNQLSQKITMEEEL